SVIPNLKAPRRRYYWFRMEAAKRRLLYTLAVLGLRVDTRDENPKTGLHFEFLENRRGKKVLTGHDNGLITMNIAEADDVRRERLRVALREPYRTLLGHFRHEIGHYYFDRLVVGTRQLNAFRTLFGDERADYSEALARHYREGAPADWGATHVSAYATMHPWEDWAETWAHYLHMVDTIGTARACGISMTPENPKDPMFAAEALPGPPSFDLLMKQWVPLTYAMNSLNRSLGMPDPYPFALAPAAVKKLRFVHRVIEAKASR
ncbi:zinc-binding metallopeptidase family protein, partial [Caballeronia choica]